MHPVYALNYTAIDVVP